MAHATIPINTENTLTILQFSTLLIVVMWTLQSTCLYDHTKKFPLRDRQRTSNINGKKNRVNSEVGNLGSRCCTHRVVEIHGEVRRRGRLRRRAAGAVADKPREDKRDEGGGHAEAERRADQVQPRTEHVFRTPSPPFPSRSTNTTSPPPPPRGARDHLPLEQPAPAAADGEERGEVGAGRAHLVGARAARRSGAERRRLGAAGPGMKGRAVRWNRPAVTRG
jgi:hypothetical protein